MTNQQGAPEALPDPSPDQLRAIARTARNSSGSTSDDCGSLAYVLHGWRAAAIAFRAHQPATHVQNPAEIEHVAGDVSKNGVESNMAQQPAPSAAAAEAQEADAVAKRRAKYLRNDTDAGRAYVAQYLRSMGQHYFDDYIQTDLAGDFACALASALSLSMAPQAPQPSPTPQADSQPAPLDKNVHRLDPSQPLHVNLAHLAKSPKAAIEAFGAEWAGWCAASAIDALRAARAPADSVTAPAKPTPVAGVERTFGYWQTHILHDPFGGHSVVPLTPADKADGWTEIALVAAPPAQAADSVLEDADPLQGAANWLAEAHGQFCVAVLQGCLMIGYNRAKRLHDAAIAARKKGGA